MNDVLSGREVNEIADSPRGLTRTPQQVESQSRKDAEAAVNGVPEIARSVEDLNQEIAGISQSIAKIRKDGKVEVEEIGHTKAI